MPNSPVPVAPPVLALLVPFLLSCSPGAKWVVERPLESSRAPRVTTIMVLKSPEVHVADDGDLPEVVARALQAELLAHGIETTVVPLAGDARIPRVELVVRSLTFGREGPSPRAGSMVVDVAFVSPENRVTFVGRVEGTGTGAELADGAYAIGHVIAERFTSR